LHISAYLEENNEPSTINNRKIGHYFSEFKGTHYMPNEMLALEYPEDALRYRNE